MGWPVGKLIIVHLTRRWREMCHRVEEGFTQLQRLVIKMPLAAEVLHISVITKAPPLKRTRNEIAARKANSILINVTKCSIN